MQVIENIGRGGGDRTPMTIDTAQLVHSTFGRNRKNRRNRMSEVHGGDTERLLSRVWMRRS
jgi:hypothetical protein